MFLNPFDGPRAKVDRAARHMAELVTAEAEYGKTQPLILELERQENGDTKVFATIARRPTAAHSTIVADIVGNLRSSLDLAVSEACRFRGANDPKKLGKTYFAFGGSEKDWSDNLNNRMPAADGVIRDAVRSLRPWKEDGNELLYALSKIAGKDKHSELVPVAADPQRSIVAGLVVSREDGKLNHWRGRVPRWDQSDREEIFSISAPSGVEFAGEPSILTARIGFGDVYALSGQPVVPVLNEMRAMCAQIVDIIEAAARL